MIRYQFTATESIVRVLSTAYLLDIAQLICYILSMKIQVKYIPSTHWIMWAYGVFERDGKFYMGYHTYNWWEASLYQDLPVGVV